MLTAMRFRSFVWPNNPRTYSIGFERETALHKVPMGNYSMQDLGQSCRVMRGEGEFFGPDAYDTFRELTRQFYVTGPGLLIHPVWQNASVYFTRLELTQEPREDFVAYSFEFREAPAARKTPTGLTAMTGSSGAAAGAGGAAISGALLAGVSAAADARYHTVVKGDTLWGIGQTYGKTVAELAALNPWLSNPNLIYAGQEVRVQ